ncbi:MAG: DUF362 domain-containing protein [candidate division KSB1 bacterium]|nr:DUF362 domain-containing protein [candidate division KSB1 bacterium]MDZ7317794.1 DUF362 domain-containing protein [candidate division KSB1 bacterium]MDZ7341675.1 DUF362 domain-containing protein [candidate division KSB1 bacterium]
MPIQKNQKYDRIVNDVSLSRRDFLKIAGAAGTGIVLGTPDIWASQQAPEKPKTNIDDALKIPKTRYSLPGPFPGKVVEVHNVQAMVQDQPDPLVINEMVAQGIQTLTGKNLKQSFKLFFKKDDVIGIKVNPVGAGLISTRLEVVDAIIDWLVRNGMRRQNIIIWDRFDYMLTEAGFTRTRFPGIGIEGLQTMDEAAQEGKTEDNSHWLKPDGTHVSADNFDLNAYYWAEVDAPKDNPYLNQHVFNGQYSYFGKLLTQKLTKIINVPVFKNTGNGISMATKNLGYAAICNTARLHKPLFFDVCTEVLAFPVIRDKLVLNITDGLRAQYDGGPGPNAKFTYTFNTLFFATDPFALDLVCHQLLVQKRKEMNVNVNEHPRFTEYLRYAERLGLGIADPEKITHIQIG